MTIDLTADLLASYIKSLTQLRLITGTYVCNAKNQHERFVAYQPFYFLGIRLSSI